MPTAISKSRPIGVFDSGLGGLTVVKALQKLLPHENIIYFGDTARVPYGTKSQESIIRFSNENTRLLVKQKVKMVVVACNSSSSCALPSLRRKFKIPILGVIEPGVDGALAVTKNNKVGVIATPATVASGAYTKQLKSKRRGIKVVSQACPLFVPLVEAGWTKRMVTKDIAREYLTVLKRAKVDSVILGCTHYPLLKTVLRGVLGKKVFLVDSAQQVAMRVKTRLEQANLLNDTRTKGTPKFLISDQPEHFRASARQFLGYKITHVRKVMTS